MVRHSVSRCGRVLSGAVWRGIVRLGEIRAFFFWRNGILTVLCVLRSGGDFTVEYVRRLRDGVARNTTIPHRFFCISDVPVPCERVELACDFPGWWSKIFMFKPGIITGPTLYLDLDTVIVGNLDAVATIPHDFAMLNIREKDLPVCNSGAMYFRSPQPHVYERFAERPQYWIAYHIRNAKERYAGDQAFISDSFSEIPTLNKALPGVFRAYKYDNCREAVPPGCSVVCFSGKPRPHEVTNGWVKEIWK